MYSVHPVRCTLRAEREREGGRERAYTVGSRLVVAVQHGGNPLPGYYSGEWVITMLRCNDKRHGADSRSLSHILDMTIAVQHGTHPLPTTPTRPGESAVLRCSLTL
jgi:hypothetical protein